MFFRWMFKSAFAILIVTNTWNIVMGVFDATQAVVNQSAGVIIGETSIDFDTLLPDLESRLEAMDIGPLLGLWFQTLVVGLTMNILSICIFLVTYGRMIEIYAVTALGPIPLATLGNAEWRGMGQNYLKSLLALGFQAFLIMVVVGIYAVLIQEIGTAEDISGAIWGCMGYTVLLCFCLFKTGSISSSTSTEYVRYQRARRTDAEPITHKAILLVVIGFFDLIHDNSLPARREKKKTVAGQVLSCAHFTYFTQRRF